MEFSGWPTSAITFYEGLEADNSKTYWDTNRATYDADVRGPMEALIDDLARVAGPGKVFRPNRDLRFSKDKTPYKTNCAASLEKVYLSLSASGFAVGRGMYLMAKDQLARYRAAVAADDTGKKLVRLAATLDGKGIEVMARDSLKTAPRGYPKDHPRIEFLRHKGLIAWTEWEPGPWMSTAEPRDRVKQFIKDTKSFDTWLADNVGPSELPDAGWG